MADPATTNFGWILPTTGGDSDSWGGLLNSNWTSADGVLGALLTATGNRITPGGANVSTAAWTTNGLRAKFAGATYTDTSSSGTVAAVYVDAFKAATIAAASATTYTNAYGAYFENPVAGTNVTFTNAAALGADSIRIGSGSVISTLTQFQTWVPTDQSGASLALTINDARYARIGNIVIILLDITYPATANGNNAFISVPVTPSSTCLASVGISSNYGTAIAMAINGASHSGDLQIINALTNNNLTNTNLSGKEISGMLIYSA